METLLSITIPTPEIGLYPFLKHGRGDARFLWRTPEITLAGIGGAAEYFGWGTRRYAEIEGAIRALFDAAHIVYPENPEMQGGIPPSPAVRPHLFGGFAFTSHFVPDVAWSAFYPAHFMLPHYQYTEIGADRYLTINVITPNQTEAEQLIPDLTRGLHAKAGDIAEQVIDLSETATISGLNYPMSRSLYDDMLHKAIAEMAAGRLDKVVLARICEMRLDRDIALSGIFSQLDQKYGDCIRFLFEPRPFHAFYGATPETLVQVTGDQLKTMGLAGSAPRGKTEAEDAAFGHGLLTSEKNRYEHDLVVSALRERLTSLSQELTIDEIPTLMKLGNIQHLYTPIEGRLKEANGILPLLEQLHPTPALGGKPRAKAIAFLAENEPITRGWYGAPVGIINPDLDGHFGVAIRSAVAQRQRVWAYAGGGIVADSNPAEEWEETEIKFRPMLEVFRMTDEQ